MKHSLLILIYFFLACPHTANAQSIGREPRENTLNKHQELASQQLSEAQIQAYTKRAKQKLVDMMDYIQIHTTSQDTAEKRQALKRLQNLFWEVPEWAKTEAALQEYVGKTRNFLITQSTVIQELTYQNSRVYGGVLSYTWSGRQDTLKFSVRKHKKQVGSKELEVWEVFFIR